MKKRYISPQIIIDEMNVLLKTTSPGVEGEYDGGLVESKQQNCFHFIGSDDEE